MKTSTGTTWSGRQALRTAGDAAAGTVPARARIVSWNLLAAPVRAPAVLELLLSASGVALAGFMVMHMAFLATAMFGTGAFDTLAGFLEDYYLLHAGVPVVAAIAAAHVLVAVRRVPARFSQQWAMTIHLRSLRHLDSTTWPLQVLTGVAIIALAAIHVWVVLTDTPIVAARSGDRVFGLYTEYYVAFLLVVEFHAATGLYRVAVKWGLLRRRTAHFAVMLWTATFLGLGLAILAALHRIGGAV